MNEHQFFEELPEGYEVVDISEQFNNQHFQWRKKTKKQRLKMHGLYGVAYSGDKQVTTGLLRFIAICIFSKKKGFIIISEDRHSKTLEYVELK